MDIRMLRHLDRALLVVTAVLTVVGILMISSAARGYVGPQKAMLFVDKQVVAAVVGLFVLATVLVLDYDEFGRMTWVLYGLNVFMLVLVLILGKVQNGAQSWISIGGFQLQPSEFGKVLLILTLGHHLSRVEKLDRFWDLLIPAMHVAPFLILLLLQPDLGTALVFVAITAAMTYMAGYPGKWMLLLGGTPIAAVVGWFVAHLKWGIPMWPLDDYQVKRLEVFVDPTKDPTGAGYHVLQSKISIGSGGLLGQGLYQGTQNQLGFLPEQHTDFIFAVIGEELGFVGGALLILLFLILLWRIMVIASLAKDQYGTLIATGAVAMVGFHVVQNVGMTLGLMPVTGIPLPFISYGGSSLIANMMAIGLALNVGMRRQKIMF